MIISEKLSSDEESALAAYVRFQNRWMSVGFTCFTIGACLMYALMRSLPAIWPTALTFWMTTDANRIPVFFICFFFVGCWGVIGNFVKVRKHTLGELKGSSRIPSVNNPHLRKVKWVPVVVGINELTGLIMLLFVD